MPSIDVAMAQSLRRAVAGGVRARDLAETASDVKTTLSSWDNCMAQSYCKWPVIAAIIVGGLIVLSVVWCIARCLCCGLSCCCGCFSCLKCCGNCCGCCDSPDKKHKHLDEPYAFPPPFAPHSGYQQPGAMMSGGAGGDGGGASPFDPPKFAHFETGPNGMAVDPPKTPVNDDALPPMPSWDTAAKRRVSLDAADDHAGAALELGELDPSTGQRVPLMTGAGLASRSASPAGAYGQPQQGGYMSPAMAMGPGGRLQPLDPYARQASAGSQRQDPYAQGDPYGRSQTASPGGGGAAYAGRGYAAQPMPAAVEVPYNPSFPAELYGSGQAGEYRDDGGGRQQPYADHRQFSASENVRPLVPAGPLGGGGYGGSEEGFGGGYGQPQPQQLQQRMGSPAGFAQPQQQPLRMDSPGFAQPPQQQPLRMDSPGFAQPQQRQFTGGGGGGGGTAPPSYASRSPPAAQGGYQGGYQGRY